MREKVNLAAESCLCNNKINDIRFAKLFLYLPKAFHLQMSAYSYKISTEKQFEALFNFATIGIVVTGANGRITNFNKEAEREFGYAKEEVLGKTVELLIPSQLNGKHKQHRKDFYHHPSPRSMGQGRDLFAEKKDGSVFPVEVSLSTYTIDETLFVIAFVVDISVRKEQETIVLKQKEALEKITAEIKQLNTSLEKKVEDRTKMLRETLSALEKSKLELSELLENEKELGELKSRFVTMASHEFKTPLSTILSSTFLLEKYNYTASADKREKHIARIKEAVSDMKSILEDFLSLGKLEEGLIKADSERLTAQEFFDVIENVIGEIEINCKKGQEINFKHAGDHQVGTDKSLVKNILNNLLSNAIKFSPENSLIEIECTVRKNNFTLSVKDKGMGISAEDKQHLFERFFRAKNAANIQGTGLGLHIISKYLELMQGTIELESRLNEGSVFTVHIPQKNKILSNEKDTDH